MAATGTLRYETRTTTDLPSVLKGRQIWHRSAPPRLLSAAAWNSGSKGWKLWRSHLASRKQAAPDRLWEVKTSGWLNWSSQGSLPEFELPAHLATGDESPAGAKWQSLLDDWQNDPHGPDRCLDTAYRLPRLAARLEGDAWWALLDRLLRAIGEADALPADEMARARQLVAGELRLTLAYLFPELKPCRKLGERGSAVISDGVLELSCESGALHATQLPDLRALIACWTRSQIIGSHVKRGSLSAAARGRYALCAREAQRLVTGEQEQLLAEEGERRWPKKLIQVANRLSADLLDHFRIPAIAEPPDSEEPDPRPRFDDSSSQSDDAEYAVLRTAWKRRGTALAVDYSGPEIAIDLNLNGEFLCRGPWRFEAQFDGERLSQLDSWESVCWVADEDAVYLELQGAFSQNVKVQRQILLARRDEFLLLNDVLLPQRRGAIEYRSSLPCLPNVSFQPALDNREMKLRGSEQEMLALPLALAEWRVTDGPGELTVKGAQLELSIATTGQALCAPLFLDLKQRDADVPYTWRPLTVAEERRILTADDAAGYRVQVGERTFVFYRSLATRGTRTVFGAHLASEFLASRLTRAGQLETLIEIE